uniref:RpoE DNA-directed RNA polymerase n=1 Tax=uncultured delta proteobacterium DeepAnt-1F12 TaxID=357894 RepID=Q2I6M4_9DELT|nr:RpoE DNA-directed RNA polymerase [uncultured delta proteobacterium DeepAnt-1F12]
MTVAETPLRLGLQRFARSVDTEAVLQETLLRVWQCAPRFEPDGRPDGLLRLGHTIARNLAISETRRARTTPVAPDALLGMGAEAGYVQPVESDPHLRAIIQSCRAELPKRPALALSARLRSTGGVTDSELASNLAMKTNTFLQNITRARKMLVECLENHGVRLNVERA